MKKGNTSKSKGKSRRPKSETARNDIPLRAKHTYSTVSTSLPRVTDTAVVRALGHTTIAAQATATTTTQLNFSLANSAISAGQWDQYKILAIRFTVTPDQNSVGLFTNTTTSYTPLYCVIDYDYSNALGSVVAAEAYNNVIVLGAGESCERTFRPRMAIAAYSGAFTAFANVADLWIDAASTGVQHYGIKIVIPGATAAQTLLPSWQLSTEYFFAFRKSI